MANGPENENARISRSEFLNRILRRSGPENENGIEGVEDRAAQEQQEQQPQEVPWYRRMSNEEREEKTREFLKEFRKFGKKSAGARTAEAEPLALSFLASGDPEAIRQIGRLASILPKREKDAFRAGVIREALEEGIGADSMVVEKFAERIVDRDAREEAFRTIETKRPGARERFENEKRNRDFAARQERELKKLESQGALVPEQIQGYWPQDWKKRAQKEVALVRFIAREMGRADDAEAGRRIERALSLVPEEERGAFVVRLEKEFFGETTQEDEGEDAARHEEEKGIEGSRGQERVGEEPKTGVEDEGRRGGWRETIRRAGGTAREAILAPPLTAAAAISRGSNWTAEGIRKGIGKLGGPLKFLAWPLLAIPYFFLRAAEKTSKRIYDKYSKHLPWWWRELITDPLMKGVGESKTKSGGGPSASKAGKK